MSKSRDELIEELDDTSKSDISIYCNDTILGEREQKFIRQIEELQEKAWKYDELCK